MKLQPTVALITRRPVPDRHFSMERVFEVVAAALSDDLPITRCQMPSYGTSLRSMFRNVRAARQVDSDVVHVTGDIHYVLPFVRASSRRILTVHDIASLNRLTGIRRLIVKLWWYSLPLRSADVVTTVSETTRAQLLAEFPQHAEKMVVVTNPVTISTDTAAQRPRPARPCVLAIGTAANKNLERLVEAASGLSAELRIIGELSPSLTSALDNAAVRYTAASNLTDEALVEEYLGATLLAFVSTSEGFGLPIVEAQSLGIPVVTSDLDPMRTVAGDAARLCDPYDVASIRSAVNDMLSDPHLRARCIARGYESVERFSPTSIAQEYLALYIADVLPRATS